MKGNPSPDPLEALEKLLGTSHEKLIRTTSEYTDQAERVSDTTLPDK